MQTKNHNPKGFKVIKIGYNYLNLPAIITTSVNTTQKVEYLYDAMGNKLAKRVDGIAAATEYYMGDVVLKGTLFGVEYLLTPEGRATKSSGLYTYEYHLKDHLGNTRVVFTDKNNDNTPEVLQVDNYYPFGMRHGQANGFSAGGNTTQYMYNGKELQQDFNLDWYDYGFRMYDPALARWMVQDPMVEKHQEWTPYAYAYNNPILFIDVMGLDTNIYVFDQANRPVDNGTGETYTAQVYVVGDDGTVLGVYDGSSYPNSRSNTDNTTQWRTVSEGEHKYNNKNGHTPNSTGITEKGLNIDDDNSATTRTVAGNEPNDVQTPITMTNVNVHEGESNNGNFSSRGSHGCVTINPSDAASFFNNFDWSGSGGVRGNTSGTISIYRGSSGDAMKSYLQFQKATQDIFKRYLE